MASSFCLRPEVTRDVILARCKYYMEVQLWPVHGKLMPERWLSNFTAAELPYAVQLLSFFLFFSEAVIDKLLIAAFQRLSRDIVYDSSCFDDGIRNWTNFIDTAIVTWIPGEIPNYTDSGIAFVRKARQVLGIKESNVMSPAETISYLINNGPRPVVFFDDFVGSGEQCRTAWEGTYLNVNGNTFESLSIDPKYSFYYCPLVCTGYGYNRILSKCSNLHLFPTHVLSDNYNVLSSNFGLWPTDLKANAFDVIRSASLRAGIPDTNGTVVNDWQGFYKLGLAIGFNNGVPDATLPIFYWEENDWKPLIRRT